MAWTPERVALLRTLWKNGMSAQLIAERMRCGLTRSAVLGKVFRLGLPQRRTLDRLSCAPVRAPRKMQAYPVKPAKQRQTQSTKSDRSKTLLDSILAAKTFKPDPIPPITDDLDIPVSERLTIHDLTETSCRWPLGDPATDTHLFCTGQKIDGMPYCAFHVKQAYQSATPRRSESHPQPQVARKNREFA